MEAFQRHAQDEYVHAGLLASGPESPFRPPPSPRPSLLPSPPLLPSSSPSHATTTDHQRLQLHSTSVLFAYTFTYTFPGTSYPYDVGTQREEVREEK